MDNIVLKLWWFGNTGGLNNGQSGFGNPGGSVYSGPYDGQHPGSGQFNNGYSQNSGTAQAMFVSPDIRDLLWCHPSYQHSDLALGLSTSSGYGMQPSGSGFGGSHSGSASPSTPWFFDSGATSHVTHDQHQIQMSNGGTGPTSVTVGNGQSIPVAHSGKGILSTPSHNFTLSNILHVPYISHNLLSVHQFAKDNNCIITFDSSGYVVQDKVTLQFCTRAGVTRAFIPLLFFL